MFQARYPVSQSGRRCGETFSQQLRQHMDRRCGTVGMGGRQSQRSPGGRWHYVGVGLRLVSDLRLLIIEILEVKNLFFFLHQLDFCHFVLSPAKRTLFTT